MAKKKKDPEFVELTEYREQYIPLVATDKHKFRTTGKIFQVHPVHVENLKRKGWAIDAPEGWEDMEDSDIEQHLADQSEESETEA